MGERVGNLSGSFIIDGVNGLSGRTAGNLGGAVAFTTANPQHPFHLTGCFQHPPLFRLSSAVHATGLIGTFAKQV